MCFHLRSDTGRYRTECRKCLTAKQKARRDSDLEYGRQLGRASYYRHSEERKAYQKAYRDTPDNKAKIRFWKSRYKYNKIQRTPKWLSLDQKAEMTAIYEEAIKRSIKDGILYHVDHIIPLQGKEVCGLHVPWNLQVLTVIENRSKSNRLMEKYL